MQGCCSLAVITLLEGVAADVLHTRIGRLFLEVDSHVDTIGVGEVERLAGLFEHVDSKDGPAVIVRRTPVVYDPGLLIIRARVAFIDISHRHLPHVSVGCMRLRRLNTPKEPCVRGASAEDRHEHHGVGEVPSSGFGLIRGVDSTCASCSQRVAIPVSLENDHILRLLVKIRA